MNATMEVSSWIPRRRLRLVFAVAVGLTLLAVVGATVTPWSLVLLAGAGGSALAGVIMLRVRWALSSTGGAWQRRIHELVAERLAKCAASGHGLDIGCGDGSLVVTLLRRLPATRWTGVDFWSERWDYGQAQCEARLAAEGLSGRADLARMDAAHLSLDDAQFQLVTSVMCFHETGAPLGAVREALRVLAPGGWFVLVDRFADASCFGPRSELDELLQATAAAVERDALTALAKLPWPLSGRRSLGPVELIVGQKKCPSAERQ